MSLLDDVAELLMDAGLTIIPGPPVDPDVRAALTAAGLPPADDPAEIEVVCEKASIIITARPPHCDRGRFLLYAEALDRAVVTIDGDDGFPRYYFGVQACASELLAWMAARRLLPETSAARRGSGEAADAGSPRHTGVGSRAEGQAGGEGSR